VKCFINKAILIALIASVLIIFPLLAFAFEASSFNLKFPTNLDGSQKAVSINHRFYGDVTDDPLDNSFGMDAGANVRINFRIHLPYNSELSFDYTRKAKEKRIGLSKTFVFEESPISSAIDISYHSFKLLSQQDESRNNFVYSTSFQTDPILERFIFTLNMGYDGYFERGIFGLGLAAEISDNLFFITEYFPVLDRDGARRKLAQYIGKEDVFAFGVKLDTYGHHFKFQLSNSTEFGLRRNSLGSPVDFLMFGFNLERRF